MPNKTLQPPIRAPRWLQSDRVCLRGLRLNVDPLDRPLKAASLAARVARYNPRMNWQGRISVSPGVRSGKPCVKGTRITVYDVLEYLAGGMSENQILADFPDLTREDIRACLAFAAARERRLVNSVA